MKLTNAATCPEDGSAGTPGAPRTPRSLLARARHWLPVFAAMTLFAQVAFQGLRPALAERRRLAQAELGLRARYERDVAVRAELAAHLRARQDPIFRERQRRLRQAPPQAH